MFLQGVICYTVSDYVEFTPFEVGMPKYGFSIPIELYGNKFYMGKVIEKFDEVPLSYLIGE